MSEHKAAIDRHIGFGLVVFAGIVACLLYAAAQAQDDQSPQKSKTVGELLRRIEKKTKKVSLSKASSALPAFQK